MNVRWMAVFTGYLVDIFITLLIQLFAGQSMLENPDLTRTDHLVVIALLTLSTGIGGYVAGRMARTDRALNGFLVAIVGILLNQLGRFAHHIAKLAGERQRPTPIHHRNLYRHRVAAICCPAQARGNANFVAGFGGTMRA